MGIIVVLQQPTAQNRRSNGLLRTRLEHLQYVLN